MGVQRRQKRPQGPIHRFFWAVPSAVRQAFAANRRPKACFQRRPVTATPRPDPSLLLGGPACRSPGLRSQQASQGHIHGFLWASKLAVCQPPKPLKRSKPSKPSKRSKPSKPSKPPKRQNPCNLQPTGVQRPASNAGHSDPTARSIASSKATSMASSGRPSLPFASP